MLDALPKNGIVAEVGVQLGEFSQAILARTSPKLLVLIDSWEHFSSGRYARDKSNVEQHVHDAHYRQVLDRFAPMLSAGHVVVLRGRSPNVLGHFPSGYFDWLYLDADHTFEAIGRDLAEASRVVRDQGLICGHDYCDRPTEGIDVKIAVDKFCAKGDWKLVMRTVDDDLCSGYDSYVLRRRPKTAESS